MADKLLFYDNFVRANNAAVGNGWVDRQGVARWSLASAVAKLADSPGLQRYSHLYPTGFTPTLSAKYKIRFRYTSGTYPCFWVRVNPRSSSDFAGIRAYFSGGFIAADTQEQLPAGSSNPTNTGLVYGPSPYCVPDNNARLPLVAGHVYSVIMTVNPSVYGAGLQDFRWEFTDESVAGVALKIYITVDSNHPVAAAFPPAVSSDSVGGTTALELLEFWAWDTSNTESPIWTDPVNVGFIGSSSTEVGKPSDAIPNYFDTILSSLNGTRTVNVVNKALSGTASFHWTPNADAFTPQPGVIPAVKLFDDAVAAFRSAGCTWVAIMLGSNDAAYHLDQPTYTANMAALVNGLNANGFRVILNYTGWRNPAQVNNDDIKAYNASLASLAVADKVFVGDTYAFDYFEQTHATEYSDETHPLPIGREHYADMAVRAFSSILAANPAMDPQLNVAPTVTIAGGSASYTYGISNPITATATDLIDGELTSSIVWTSDIQAGTLATGGTLNASVLDVGVHTLTATVTDSGSLTASDTVQITILAAPEVATSGSQIAVGGYTVALVDQGNNRYAFASEPYAEAILSTDPLVLGGFPMTKSDADSVSVVTLEDGDFYEQEAEVSVGGMPILVRRTGSNWFFVLPPAGQPEETVTLFYHGVAMTANRYGSRWYLDL